MGKKIELPAEGIYEPPADATLQDLAEIRADAQAQAERLLADGATAEDVAQATRLLDAADAVDGRVSELQAEQEEHQRTIDAARARLQTPDDDADAGDGTDDEDEDEDADAGGAGGQAAGTPAGTPDAPAAQSTIGEPALVAAGAGAGRRRSRVGSAVAAAARTGAHPQLPARAAERERGKPAYLTAASGVRGLQAGAEIGWPEIGVAAENRFTALPVPAPGTQSYMSPQTKLPIGSVHILTHDDALVASGSGQAEFVDARAQIDWAVSHRRLEKAFGLAEGSDEDVLLAAGGWCSPSETLYDLLDITTDDGMLDVPGITVSRGGVRFALGPDFTAVYNGGQNFTRTEAQAIAGSPTKPMVNIPCPTFTDNRMLVDGMFLTGDILTSRGYPEAYTDFMQKALKAWAHYVNSQSIIDIINLSGTLIDLSGATGTAPVTNRTGSATVELLGAIELQITDMRYKNRLSMTQAVEVILPFWVKGNIRTDIAKRQGYENAFQVSDADIASWFALRGASIQFVYDWQDAFTGVAAGFGAATAITGWPTTAEALIYPEGTFVRALDPVIELNAVYDSQLLQTNQYVALFMEQGRLTLKRHHDARRVKINVTPLGGTTGGAAPLASGAALAGNVL